MQKIKLEIAGYQICPIPTGIFGLDGGAMFGTVPKSLWQKTNPADDQNRIRMEARALLLKGHGRNILIDCGNGSDFIEKYGEKLGGKFQEIYAVDSSGPTLISSLKSFDVTPEEITDVILTHLHFDHAGGATCFRNGKVVPTFSNAKYYVQKENFETAKNPNIREKASYLAANFEPLVQAGVLQLLSGPTEIFPYINVQLSHGHTIGQQNVLISDDDSGIFYCADLIPTSSHIRLAWIMGYDLDPLKIIEEKRKALGEAANKNWYLYFEHDPDCDAAKVSANGSDFSVSEKFIFS